MWTLRLIRGLSGVSLLYIGGSSPPLPESGYGARKDIGDAT